VNKFVSGRFFSSVMGFEPFIQQKVRSPGTILIIHPDYASDKENLGTLVIFAETKPNV
jgi:hypothetical protein